MLGPVAALAAASAFAPGSAAAPLRATFRRRGDPAVTLFVTWSGLAHVTAPALGLDFGMQYLGTVTLPVSQTHHVAEIRALLTAAEGAAEAISSR